MGSQISNNGKIRKLGRTINTTSTITATTISNNCCSIQGRYRTRSKPRAVDRLLCVMPNRQGQTYASMLRYGQVNNESIGSMAVN